MKKIIFAFTILLFFGCKTSKEIKKPVFTELTNLIDKYASETLQKNNINSLAIAVYKNDNFYHNYYGEIDKNAGNKPNDSTLFEIASISKVFLGSLVAKAVLEYKLTLNDDIRMYLKGDYANLEFEGTPITIKNLLTHTLGFKNKNPKGLVEFNKKVKSGYYEKNNEPYNYNINDFLNELKNSKLNKKPGTFYQYNSVGPELLAYILEQVYNKSYKSLLKKFFIKLEMNNTYLNDYSKIRNRIANGYKGDTLMPLERNPLLGGTAGIVTTLPDLSKFMKFQLKSKNSLIKESTTKLFDNNDGDELGYLWEVGEAKEEGFYYLKSGTSKGIQSVILICPDTNYGFILIANNTSDKAFNNWVNLYYSIENNLIKYPKMNLVALLEKDLLSNTDKAIKKYKKLIVEENAYYTNATDLNNLGYKLLNAEKNKEAISIFKLLVLEFSDNYNAYDSLGEAYFKNKDYKKALLNYNKSLELYPNNSNAKKYINKINKIEG
ncbi:serine hydrolase [Polaribacter sp. R77954]|uniref:serine hydrolase n=1 Tax=Polaribacter sp. R77954 TaxID=3093870 RepID=UPI0037C7721D